MEDLLSLLHPFMVMRLHLARVMKIAHLSHPITPPSDGVASLLTHPCPADDPRLMSIDMSCQMLLVHACLACVTEMMALVAPHEVSLFACLRRVPTGMSPRLAALMMVMVAVADVMAVAAAGSAVAMMAMMMEATTATLGP